MTDKIRVGVVGVGYLGKIHAKIYHQMENVELVMLADHRLDDLKEYQEAYGCAITDNYLDLIDEVDAVSVVVPTTEHFDVTQPFLEAGIATLLEKPIAATLDEAKRLVDLAAQNQAPFLIGHLERYNPAMTAVMKQMAEPRYIEVHRLGTFVERATDVDVVTDLMIHDLDLVLALFDEKPIDVQAIGGTVVTDFTDVANVRLGFANGAVANITASRVSQRTMRRFRIFDNHNTHFGIDLANSEVDVVRKGTIPEGGKFADIISEKQVYESGKSLNIELQHFIEVAKGESMPMVTGKQGLEALDLVDQVQAILRESENVKTELYS